MNKIKIIVICVFVAFLVFVGVVVKNKQEFRQKAVLAQEIRKVLEHLMLDLSQAREKTVLDLPADGQWHHRIAFDSAEQGALEYVVSNGHLLRTNHGQTLLIADHINDVRIRRQDKTPDILEVQIEAKENVSLVSNLKIRIRQ